MSVRLRLSRVGRRKAPAYRIVAVNQAAKRDGACIEIIGRYQPLNPNVDEQLVVDAEKAMKWLKTGASPSDTVASLLRKKGVLKAFHEFKVAQVAQRKARAAAAEKSK
jgi:small subunit ribosomal protein S16